MTTHVLFMCPHAAGKSLFAATYFRAAAGRHGLDVEIELAGPEPDPENMANVQGALVEQGFTIGWHPRRVVAADFERADVAVSIGCDASGLPAESLPAGSLREWDVPMLSEDFEGSMRAIYRHVEELASELAIRPAGGS